MSLLQRTADFMDRLASRSAVSRTLVLGDIIRQATDAVVNAADSSLLGGTGVDAALREAAGPELAAAVRALGGCPIGHARITPGYNLPCSFVIHTVAPVFSYIGVENNDAAMEVALAACFRSATNLADRYSCKSISFPALGAGAFGWPLADVARIAAETAGRLRCRTVREVRFVAFSRYALKTFETALGVEGVVQAEAATLHYHAGISASNR